MKITRLLVAVASAALSLALAAECPTVCTQELAPVCASNGKTYNNQCEFEVEKCKTNSTTLQVVNSGVCAGSGSASGEGKSVGSPECSKEFACLDVSAPVCGSNGITYTNNCVLKKAQCVDKTVLKVGDGECKKDSPSASGSGSGSGSSSGAVVCMIGCTKEIDYVCGSDDVTYANECLLEEEKQCKVPLLTKAKDGACSGSSSGASDATPSPAITHSPSSSVPPSSGSSRSGASPSWILGVAAAFGGIAMAWLT